MGKRILSVVVAALFAAGFLPVLVPAARAAERTWHNDILPSRESMKDFDFRGLPPLKEAIPEGLNLTFNTADTQYTFTGDPGSRYEGLTLTFTEKVTVTLTNIAMKSNNGANAAIYFNAGGTLILRGTNVIESGRTVIQTGAGAGIGIESGSLVIMGDGSLTVSSLTQAAAIGGGRNKPGGDITIKGDVKITAVGHGSAAAIGGGGGAASGETAARGGNIVLSENAQVTTIGGKSGGAGVGGGGGGSPATAMSLRVGPNALFRAFSYGDRTPVDAPVTADFATAMVDLKFHAPVTAGTRIKLTDAATYKPLDDSKYAVTVPSAADGGSRAAFFVPVGQYMFSAESAGALSALAGANDLAFTVPVLESGGRPEILNVEKHDSYLLTLKSEGFEDAARIPLPRSWDFSLPRNGVFARERRQLDAWSESADGRSALYPSGTSFSPTKDTTLYAQWGPVVRFAAEATGTATRSSLDGTIQLSGVSGSSDGYLYKLERAGTLYADWTAFSPSGGSAVISGLKYGNYKVVVCDASDEQNAWSQEVSIARPGDLGFSYEATHLTRRGSNEGTLIIQDIKGGVDLALIGEAKLKLETQSGELVEEVRMLIGISPTVGIDEAFTGLAAGTYTVTLWDPLEENDEDPNRRVDTVTITEPEAVGIDGVLTYRAPTLEEPGSVKVKLRGGNGAYEFQVLPSGEAPGGIWSDFGSPVSGWYTVDLMPGEYTLYVRDPEDTGNSACTDLFTIHVEPYYPEVVLQEKTVYHIIQGDTVSLRVFASTPDGGSLSYQWQYVTLGGESAVPVAASKGGNTPFCSDEPTEDRVYSCIVTNEKMMDGTLKKKIVTSQEITVYVNSDRAVTKPVFYPKTIVVPYGSEQHFTLSASGSVVRENGRVQPESPSYRFSAVAGGSPSGLDFELNGNELILKPETMGQFLLNLEAVGLDGHDGETILSEPSGAVFTIVVVAPPEPETCSCLLLSPVMIVAPIRLDASEAGKTVGLSAAVEVRSADCALHRDTPEHADMDYEIYAPGTDASIDARIGHNAETGAPELTVSPRTPGNHTVSVRVTATHEGKTAQTTVQINVYKEIPEIENNCDCSIAFSGFNDQNLTIGKNNQPLEIELFSAGQPALVGSCLIHTQQEDTELHYYWRVLENTAGGSVGADDRLTVTRSGLIRLELKIATAHVYREQTVEFYVKSQAIEELEHTLDRLGDELEDMDELSPEDRPAAAAQLRLKAEQALADFFKLSEWDRSMVSESHRKLLDDLVGSLNMMQNSIVAPSGLNVNAIGLATVRNESDAISKGWNVGYTLAVNYAQSGTPEYGLAALALPQGHNAGLYIEVELFRTLEGVIESVSGDITPLLVTVRLPASMRAGTELTIVHVHTDPLTGQRTLSYIPCQYNESDNSVRFTLDSFSLLMFSNVPAKAAPSYPTPGQTVTESDKLTLTGRELEAAGAGKIYELSSGDAFYRIDAVGALAAARKALQTDVLPDEARIVFTASRSDSSFVLGMTVEHGGTRVNPSVMGAFAELYIPVDADYTSGVFRVGEQIYHTPTAFIEESGARFARLTIQTGFPYFLVWNETTIPGFGNEYGQHWSRKAVEELAERLTLGGAEGGAYLPDAQISRAAFVAFSLRAFGIETSTEYRGVFSDVSATDWYASALQTAYDMGLVSGIGGGRFGPLLPIAREQAVAMLYKMALLMRLDARLPKKDLRLDAFIDAGDISDWARAGLDYALIHDLMTGRGGWVLAPRAALTNAESAQLIWNMLKKSDMI